MGEDAKTQKLTASHITKILIANYHSGQDWLTIPELRTGVGYGIDCDRYIDLFAFKIWEGGKHPKYQRIAYEIKVSAPDFYKDVAEPLKQRPAKLACNQFFYVAPEGIIPPKSIPLDCGLIEIGERIKGNPKAGEEYRHYLQTACQSTDLVSYITIPSPLFDYAPTWSFCAALIRGTQQRQLGASPKREETSMANGIKCFLGSYGIALVGIVIGFFIGGIVSDVIGWPEKVEALWNYSHLLHILIGLAMLIPYLFLVWWWIRGLHRSYQECQRKEPA